MKITLCSSAQTSGANPEVWTSMDEEMQGGGCDLFGCLDLHWPFTQRQGGVWLRSSFLTVGVSKLTTETQHCNPQTSHCRTRQWNQQQQTKTLQKNIKNPSPVSHNVLHKITILCWAEFIATLQGMWPVDSGLDTAARTFFNPCWIETAANSGQKWGGAWGSYP